MSGGHSLAAWGERLGNAKIEFNDFSKLTDEMIEYCHQDVAVTAELFVKMMKTLTRIGFTEESIKIQHLLTVILDKQRRNGFKFDGRRALLFYQELRRIEEEIAEKIYEVFPPELKKLNSFKRAYKKDGSPTNLFLKHQEIYEKVHVHDDGSYDVYGLVPFNIGSPNQRVQKLLELGWEPEEFTEKTKKGGGGNPKPFDKGKLSPSLERFVEETDNEAVKLIARWMTINGRANMVNNWIDNWNEETGCIHGRLFVADTLRLRHQAPNTANIPAVRVKEYKNEEGRVIRKEPLLRESGDFTYEARDLWVARPGRVLVGTDAAGLELRMLAHFLNRPDFSEQVISGDVHQYNADLAGVTRTVAKTMIYAILYGAAAPKIAKTIGVSVREGARIRKMFLEKLGLDKLIEESQHEQSNGRVILIDGSRVICPSPHSALNYKLQGSGARVMARGAILLEQAIHRYRLDSLKVGDIHDEWQYDVHPDHAEKHAILAVKAIQQAGKVLGCNVPLDGESKIGKTWAATH